MHSFFDLSVNTCFATTSSLHTIAYYSHILPLAIGLLLSFLIYKKSHRSTASKVFLAFVVTFCLWLVGDLIAWVSPNYHFVYASWALLDFFNVVFFVLGAYFFETFVLNRDIGKIRKMIYGFLVVPAFGITVALQSVSSLYHPYCEAVENEWLTYYKFFVEVVCVAFIVVRGLSEYKKSTESETKKKILTVGLSTLLFFVVFSITELIATQTNFYEINLYSLFVLPMFLVAILYSIVNFGAFNLRTIGSQLLVYGFILLIAVQFLFLNDVSDKLLNAFTLAMALVFSYILFRNFKKETEQREHIEELSLKLTDANNKLQSLDKLKTEFLSLASHQLRSPLTAIKGYTSMLLEGSFGAMTMPQKEAIDRVFQSVQHLTKVVNDLLNVSKIEQGGMKYEMQEYDFGKSVKGVTEELSLVAKNKHLALSYEDDGTGPFRTRGDEEKMRQVLINLIDNSIKYTQTGNIWVRIGRSGEQVLLSIHDTGMGMTEEIKQTLFKKFARGEGGRVNTSGSGLGLYLAKEIVEAHHGRIWVESPGPGKGSTFFVELERSR